MNAFNIMWLLKELDNKSQVEITYNRSKHIDSIHIETPEFQYQINEYGQMVLSYKSKISAGHCESGDYWFMVKSWVKDYLNEVM